MIQEGFLIISDISGYSTYLNESELEHARDSLTDLLNILVDHTKSPLVISKLEGDAVFSYVNKGSIFQGQTLIEIVENTYAAFRKALDLMIINTSCTCNACRNLPNLDLKFFIHYGQFSTQRIGNYAELVGNDVNIVHRLLKNTIAETLGLEAYAFYSEAVTQVLQEDALFINLPTHEDHYPNVGKIKGYVQDLHEVWSKKKNEMRVVVTEEDALLIIENDFPVPPMILWNYVTKSEYRALMLGSDYQEVLNQQEGRTGVDAVYVCAHGKNRVFQTILDWEPFEQYTTHQPHFLGMSANYTHRIVPTETGSKLIMYWGKAIGNRFLAVIDNWVSKNIIVKQATKSMNSLRETILRELEEGKTIFEPSIKIEPIKIISAVEEALATQELG